MVLVSLELFVQLWTKNAAALFDLSLTWQRRRERWGNRKMRFGVSSKKLLPSNNGRDYTRHPFN